MGGRGTYAAGKNVAPTYETVGTIHGIKVLRGLDDKHNIPEESHSSSAYILLYPDGNFRKLGEYDSRHYLTTVVEIHPEPLIEKSRKPVLHIHFIDQSFRRTKARLLTKEELSKYQKFLQGRMKI